jgi:hypothetical protein
MVFFAPQWCPGAGDSFSRCSGRRHIRGVAEGRHPHGPTLPHASSQPPQDQSEAEEPQDRRLHLPSSTLRLPPARKRSCCPGEQEGARARCPHPCARPAAGGPAPPRLQLAIRLPCFQLAIRAVPEIRRRRGHLGSAALPPVSSPRDPRRRELEAGRELLRRDLHSPHPPPLEEEQGGRSRHHRWNPLDLRAAAVSTSPVRGGRLCLSIRRRGQALLRCRLSLRR